jgi:hypothetical protein
MYDFLATSGSIQHNGFVDATNALGYKVILNASAFSGAATSCPGVMMLVDLLAYCTLTNATIVGTGTKVIVGTEVVTFDNGAPGLRMITAADFDTYTPVRFTTAGALPTGLAIDTTYWTVRVDATHSKLATSLVNAIAGTVIAYSDAGTPANTMWCWLPRYGDGKGVQALLSMTTASTAGAPTYQLTYVNSGGTGSRVTPSAPALPTGTAVSPLLNLTFSGTGSGKFGPFFPQQAPDTGIRYITNIILGTAGCTTGVEALCFVRPLLTLPLTTIGVAAERDLVNQLPSMPRVYDGACLVWLYYSQLATPNNTAFYGHLDFGWSG